MAKQQQIDVYRHWLGIPDTNRPLNHYQLLRLKKFEDDPALIRAHFQKLNTHVRKYQQSEPERVQTLLDELTKAMLCLTDSRRKGEYDTSLGRTGAGEMRKRSMEEILVGRKVLDREKLAEAHQLADAIGVELRDALMQQKLAKPEVVMQAYAESLGLPFLDLKLMTINPELIPKIPAVLARQHSCVPLLVDGEKALIASPNPLRSEVEEELRLRFGVSIRAVLCTPADIHEIINVHYPKEAAAKQIGVTLPSGGGHAKETVDPVERRKRRNQIAIISGMFSGMAFTVVGSVLGWSGRMGLFTFYGAVLGVVVVAGGIGWIVGTLKS